MSRSWDVFCKVVDNFGDAAVCWRLSRQLAADHGGRVRLWIDAPAVLHALCPQVSPTQKTQRVDGVEICRWIDGEDPLDPVEVCIEAFGCGLPEGYAGAMARRTPRTLWIVLEYLSAERWVAAHHGLPSPHPRLDVERFFFFPGVVPGTGGVLRESGLAALRAGFQTQATAAQTFWRSFGYSPPEEGTDCVSLFGYENAATADLLRVWAEGGRRTVVAIPQSRLRPAAAAFFGTSDPADGATRERGNLEARFLPFVPQRRYDELLWISDWNFVRGEDSFVRAQWAARPMVWQIYPQSDCAHLPKLDAFLEVYCAGLAAQPALALCSLWRLWNALEQPAEGAVREAWNAVCPYRQELRSHAQVWEGRLAAIGDLATNLTRFCADRLK